MRENSENFMKKTGKFNRNNIGMVHTTRLIRGTILRVTLLVNIGQRIFTEELQS